MIARALAVLFCLGSLALQQQAHSQGMMGIDSLPGTRYLGPGDKVSGATAYWGLDAYSAAFALSGGRVANVCDVATTSTCTDVNILAAGFIDAPTAAALPQCGTACCVKIWYDQTGNGHDLTVVAVNAICPPISFNQVGYLPLMVFTAASKHGLTTASFPALSGTTGFTYAGVAQRTSGASVQIFGISRGTGAGEFLWAASANVFEAYNGVGPVTQSASDNVLHALQAVMSNTAAGGVIVDGTANISSTGNQDLSGNFDVGWYGTGNVDYLNGKMASLGVWPVPFNATQYGNVEAVMKSNWGTP